MRQKDIRTLLLAAAFLLMLGYNVTLVGQKRNHEREIEALRQKARKKAEKAAT